MAAVTGDVDPAARTIAAAGGLVWRPGGDGCLVCLVHRPRYDDWSLPKGKVKRGEHPLAAAVREVGEETGVRAVPRLPLPPTRYQVEGVPKVVDYWGMSAAEVGELQANSEVDGVAWLPAAEAMERVRYPHDAALLRRWAALPRVTGVVLLVRHADAGDRIAPPEADHARPLTSRGQAGAQVLRRLLALFAPTRVVSASPRRCQQSVARLALAANLPVEVDPVFDEDTGDPDAASARVRQLAVDGDTTVICSQGKVIPLVLARLTGTDGPPPAGEEAALRTGPANALPSGDLPALGELPAFGGPGGGAGQRSGWTTGKGDGWLLPFAGPHPLASAPLGEPRVRQ